MPIEEELIVKSKCQVLVSIIIPVYNVYEWIDQCMDSVINQTMPDFEVILINDGSTDGSETKCLEWEKKDSRVRVISKENGGLSAARNCGIQNAKGEFLVFIDSDDWVDSTYLEKLYKAVVDNKAAISECDVYRYDDRTGEETYRDCSGSLGLEYTLEEHMKYGYTAIWKCMIRKSLFVDYGITFPDCHSPARAIYPLLLAVGGGIANVHEGLYFYRRFRTNSLSEKPRVNNGDENAIGLLAFDNLLQGFQVCGLYHRYENTLQEIVKSKLSDLLAGLFYRRKTEEFLQLVEKYYSYIEEKFPGTANFRYITLGGYNLNRILGHMNVLHNPYTRFNFTSIVSLMHPVSNLPEVTHPNKYREIMVQRDMNSSFWHMIHDVRPKYIFLDFIEERFDILEYKGGYITKSDAFDGSCLEIGNDRLIERTSEECMELWKDSFRKFVETMESRMPGCKIVVVENYLSEEVGDIHEKMYFSNVDEIRSLNQILKQYYKFAADSCQQILWVKAFESKYYYTDKQYEYGAIPSHLNEVVNLEIAKKIERVIRGE